MTMKRRVLLTTGASALAAGLAGAILPAGPGTAAETIQIVGNKLKWRGNLRRGWIGGNADQIERIMRSSDGDLRKIMQLMLPQAKQLDLYFFHTDVTAKSTDVATELKSNVLKLQLDLKSDPARAALWQAFTEKFNQEAAGKTVKKVESDKTSTTGGRASFTAVMRADVKAGGAFYDVYHVVEQGGGNWHLLNMQTDGTKYKARSEEFDELLQSIRYGA
jgi:hypothetical protein